MNNRLVILLFASLGSACSTYTTNSSLVFESTDMAGINPSIYIGEVTEKPENLELLGWVDAVVTKPNIFAEDPTEEQAAIVLAKKGEDLGANAVVYVDFKKSMTSGLLRKMTARGQAVKLRSETLQTINTTELITPANSNTPELVKPSTNYTPAQPTTSTNTGENMGDTTGSGTIESFQSSEDILKLPPKSWQKNKSAVSLHQHLENTANLSAGKPEILECKPSINEIVDYQYKVQTYKFMLSNAEYLLKKSRGLKDEEMALASERLIRQISQQQEWLKTQKPAE